MNSNETKKINAIFIIEVMGRPPEHLTYTLENIANQIGAEKGVKIVDKKINPPTLMKDQKDFYVSFAEIEVEVEDILNVVILMFKYMPAHIEIISPQSLVLSNCGWNDILNELTRRLHGYEEIARILQNEKFILENKLRAGTSSSTHSSKSQMKEFMPKEKISEGKNFSEKKQKTKRAKK